MNKLVDMQKAFDAVCKYFHLGNAMECTRLYMALEEAYELTEELKWIPVEERLPDAGIRYQVTFESGEVGYADFRSKMFLLDGSAKENVWEIEQYYEDDGEVIAWMPLPEPYEGSK